MVVWKFKFVVEYVREEYVWYFVFYVEFNFLLDSFLIVIFV